MCIASYQKRNAFVRRYQIFTIILLPPSSTSHWTYLLQILSKLCFQRVAFSGNYEIVAISTDKTTIFNDLDYKADIGQHFHKSEKSARWRHRHKIIKTNLKTHISPLLTRPQGSQGCQKMHQDPLSLNLEVWYSNIESQAHSLWFKKKNPNSESHDLGLHSLYIF